MEKLFKFVRKNPFEIFLFSLFLAFSALIMFKTFAVEDGNLKIASKAWSDFAATIPLIRSFSLGDNFPPQYPIFPGPPIRYHFVFFFLVGILEKTGIRIDLALNLLSTFSFFLLTVAIYLLAKEVFNKKSVALLSVLLFIFNGSLSFLEFFKANPLSVNTLKEIITNSQFPSFGPYDGKIVSAFWNLNIYTNQRHLALGYAVLFIVFLVIYKAVKSPEKLTFNRAIILGLIVGLMPFVHLTSFVMVGVTLGVFFVIYPGLRKKIITIGFIAGILSLPQIMYMGLASSNYPLFKPGYLIENLNLGSFFKYWFFNLGLTAVAAPLGFFLAKKEKRKIFLPFIVFFVLANLFQFSTSLIDNHKFLNASVIGANILASYLLVLLWKKHYIKIVVPISLFLLIFSGIIDLFPILNDGHLLVEDIPKNKTATFILANTKDSSVFINANYLYDPASLAGRKIYLGWPYFPWSLGYDVDTRREALEKVLNSTDKAFVCSFAQQEGIDYIEVQKPSNIEHVFYNYGFFENNFAEFYGQNHQFKIYDVKKSCGDI